MHSLRKQLLAESGGQRELPADPFEKLVLLLGSWLLGGGTLIHSIYKSRLAECHGMRVTLAYQLIAPVSLEVKSEVLSSVSRAADLESIYVLIVLVERCYGSASSLSTMI